MTRLLLAAAALGTLTGLALTFGTGGAVGVAVCAGGVIAWCLVCAIRVDRRQEAEKWSVLTCAGCGRRFRKGDWIISSGGGTTGSGGGSLPPVITTCWTPECQRLHAGSAVWG